MGDACVRAASVEQLVNELFGVSLIVLALVFIVVICEFVFKLKKDGDI